MSRFFIDHPVFAWVIAIVIMLMGILSIRTLPVEQYPSIAPPSVSISTSYPGASAEALENSVTQVIEQKLTGIDNMRYFSATSDSAGNVSINITFELGTDPDIAQVQVQNKVQAAMPLLPQDVQNQGVVVAKANDSILLAAAFYTEDGSISQQELSDIINSKLLDSIARVNGVGNVRVLGQPHAMRIWLNPDKLTSYALTAKDIQTAIEDQNIDVSAGQLGALPAVAGQALNATVTAQSLLKTVDDFKNIIVRVNADGSSLRLDQVARVEMGSQSYDVISRYKRKPATALLVSLNSGSNALETSDKVKAKIEDSLPLLGEKIRVAYPYDATPFVRLSIHEVIKTLIEAAILVFAVIFLFLQNFRATLIPSIAIPIVLLGTFAILNIFGFTINTLTLFAMVLAIGLLVDDAIVVVENVERIMHEEKLSAREATRKSMDQITSALIGIALVLSAIFVPMAFFAGSAGAIYRQFSITIVSSMALSVLVALILSPPLCATLLKAKDEEHEHGRFFKWFNSGFDRVRDHFVWISNYVSARVMRFFVIYGLLLAVLYGLFTTMPTSFLPAEDQGSMRVLVTAPPGATAERTLESVKQVEDYFLNQEADNVEHLFMVVGFSFSGRGQNSAMGFVGLKDWSLRERAEQSVAAISKRAGAALAKIKDATVIPVVPPPIRELGNASGFELQLLDKGGRGHTALISARNELLDMAKQDPQLTGVRPNGLEDVAQYKINIDRDQAQSAGVNLGDVNDMLKIAWGGLYVNDFIDNGRLKRVYVQADSPFRMEPEDLHYWYVRSQNGQMVPLQSFSKGEWVYNAARLERFNGTPSVNIQGAAATGVSSGVAMDHMEEMAKKLPNGYDFAWSGMSYEERLAGSQTGFLYAISVLVIFLCLAALYESWMVPFSVLLVIPLGVLGAVAATYVTGLANDVYFQVGLLTTMGLTAKNAILIVEFAKAKFESGQNLRAAMMEAVHLRFRPIIMTSIAFMLGVTPLVIASGAGSASQNAIGICVIGGMIAATFLAFFFIPMFYVFIQEKFGKILEKNPPLDHQPSGASEI
ncbi:MAG: efflux RND transporter permease subunit [Alphaproteobacteria bacterium]|nr:efflux RND transporter permease subunit [Alphaproteobacteria bacterium]